MVEYTRIYRPESICYTDELASLGASEPGAGPRRLGDASLFHWAHGGAQLVVPVQAQTALTQL